MISHEILTPTDKIAFLARLGEEILVERKRLASELRALLNERRFARTTLKKNETQNHKV